jgi:ABC-type amino acid transport substrate-binding protein
MSAQARRFNGGIRIALAALAVAALLVVASCGDDDDDGGGGAAGSGDVSSQLNLMTSGTVTVGMNLQFKPQMYLDDGEPAGYDVDLLNQLADAMGVKLDIKNLDFNGLIPGLQSKQFDMVSVGLNATPERKQAVDFSRGYVPYSQVLAIPADADSPAAPEDLNASGTTITALQGSTAEQLAKKQFPEAKVDGFADQNAAFLQVASGRADGIIVEDYLLAQYEDSNPGQLKKADFPEPLDVQYGSWAVQKGNSAFVAYLDDFLCKAQGDGTLEQLYKKNFGVDELPPMPPC